MTPHALPARDPISPPLPWQHDAWETLTGMAGHGRLPHALLISGEEGSGRRRFATALCRYFLCQGPIQGTNCGRCKTCMLSQNEGHSDWRWVAPIGKTRSVGIDQIRDVIRFTAQTSALGKYKILVIHPADGMTLAAANAFLKCLEEPAPDTLILLVTRSPAGVPATIRSRCQHLRLPTPHRGAALAWLALLNGDETRAERALDAAHGMPLLADSLLTTEGALESAEARHQLISALFAGKGDQAEIAALLSTMDADTLVSELLAQLHNHLRALSGEQLRAQTACALLDVDGRLRDLQRAIAGGATPQKELLGSALTNQLTGILGSGPSGC